MEPENRPVKVWLLRATVAVHRRAFARGAPPSSARRLQRVAANLGRESRQGRILDPTRGSDRSPPPQRWRLSGSGSPRENVQPLHYSQAGGIRAPPLHGSHPVRRAFLHRRLREHRTGCHGFAPVPAEIWICLLA